MKYFRIYADASGETHFEDVDVPAAQHAHGSQLSQAIAATSVVFRQSSPDQHMDWHTAPRRQFVITLLGEAEVEASDGEVRRLRPGTVMLAEDLSGKGHILRGVGTADRVSISVPLVDQTPTSPR